MSSPPTARVTHIRVTPRQDVLLCGIAPTRIAEVEQRLRDHGVPLAGDVTALRRLAIACPALPTCGQALGEAERVLPSLVDELEKAMSDGGLPDVPIRVNMTGCPNGCARPYTAEIGIVGRTKKTYDVYVGGAAAGDRLATLVRADVPLDQIATVVAPLFAHYARSSEVSSFGDWADGVGQSTIETWLPEPVVRQAQRCCGSAVTVHLVGAGPGDPDLLTVRAARLLAAADVVVHDALVGDGVLALVNPAAELIDVGKRPGRGVPQELISTLLVTLAEDDRTVVRLKGGDPFVFGRGGEEAQALLDAGVPFEVVPGVTSAFAAPAAAGVPVTHRGVSAAVTVVTGHRRSGEPDVDWRSLAGVGGTIVVLMGVTQRGHIAAELIAGGLACRHARRCRALGDDRRSGRAALPPRRARRVTPRVTGRDRDRSRRRLRAARRSPDETGRSAIQSGLHGLTSSPTASASSSTVSTRLAIPSA